MQTERWNPDQYAKFRGERMQPFFDLLALIRPEPGMRVVDLGCGPGELTALLAERLPGAVVVGIDNSDAMLAQSGPFASERISFRRRDITTMSGFGAYDLIFSHAALQWVPDNQSLITRILEEMKPGAQIAVQVPKNEAHPSHRLAGELAREEPYREWLGGYHRRSDALPLERYAEIMYACGVREQVCFEKIYGHELESSRAVVEWVKGTSLNAYLSRLSAAQRDQFLDAYTERLVAAIGDRSPYFYPFRRLLFWGRKPA